MDTRKIYVGQDNVRIFDGWPIIEIRFIIINIISSLDTTIPACAICIKKDRESHMHIL